MQNTALRTTLSENLLIFSDSVSIMQRTITPKTFFERYNTAVDIAEDIAAAYCISELYDDVDEWCEWREKLVEEKDDYVTDFLNRLYETYKFDALYEVWTKYSYELSEKTQKHIEYLLKDIPA